MNVRGQVAIAEIEPVGSPEHDQSLQRMKGFAAVPPALRGIDEAGQRVRDNVQVRRDLQPVERDVVPGVDDDGQFARVHDFVETEEELRGTHAAGESGDGFCFHGAYRSRDSHWAGSIDFALSPSATIIRWLPSPAREQQNATMRIPRSPPVATPASEQPETESPRGG